MVILDFSRLRIAALLHDVGKPLCWAKEQPWPQHVWYTYTLVEETLGSSIAETAMRHHSGPAYEPDLRPISDEEKIIDVADDIASGADRQEEAYLKRPRPKPPIQRSHPLSNGESIQEFDARELAYTAEEIKKLLLDNQALYRTDPSVAFRSIYDGLRKTRFNAIPAFTEPPINDHSLFDHSKLTAAIANCIARESGYIGDSVEKYRFALISGDADKIQSYINISSRLPDLKEGSRLVEDATGHASSIVSKVLGPECVLFVGGGNFLALSPPSLASELSGKAKEAFEASTSRELTMTVNHMLVDGQGVKDHFGLLWKNAAYALRLKKLQSPIPAARVEEGNELCDICRRRKATHVDAGKILPIDAAPRPERLCDICWQRRSRGSGIQIDALRDNNDMVGLIRIDGDKMGEVFSGSRLQEFNKKVTPSRLSALSELVDSTCKNVLAGLVSKHRGECIFAGGDDLLALSPGCESFKLAAELADAFRRSMNGKASISAGIVAFKFRLPLYSALECCTELLRKAKGAGRSRVAYTVIGGVGSTPDEVEPKIYEWSGFSTLLSLVEQLRRQDLAASQMRKIVEAAAKNVDAAKYLVKYGMGRGVINWDLGKRIMGYLDSGVLIDAYQVHSIFR